jgi:hypothetical protein
MLVFLIRWQTKDILEDIFSAASNTQTKILNMNQGKLTEVEGSVLLTSALR